MPQDPQAQQPDPAVPVLVDFLSTVPTPITGALVALGPTIARVRHTADVLGWRGGAHWSEGWLMLAAWWAICLLSEGVIRYALPLAIVFTLAIQRYTSSPNQNTSQAPATEASLSATIADLAALQSVFAPSPAPPSPSNSAPVTLTQAARVAFIVYVPYLLLTYFVRLRVLVALAGTVVLTHNAPFARVIRRTLWRSAHLRWATYRLWALLSGTPPPASRPLPPSLQVASSSPSMSSVKGNELRFLITVYENQRWWVGLDWTAALLPNERPAWCAGPPGMQPVAPPAALALPRPTTVRVGGTRRTATWHWAEDEWRVLVRPAAGEGTKRVERTPPAARDDAAPEGGAGGRMLRAAGKMAGEREGSRSPERKRKASVGGEGGEKDDGEEETADPATDADGWVYGDNKWENASVKGGIGKYTRYRRWTRIALVTETVEDDTSAESAPAPAPKTNPEPEVISPLTDKSPSSPVHVRGESSSSSTSARDALRNRLKNAAQRTLP